MFFHENFPVKMSPIVRKNSFIMPHIVPQNATKTAASVPRWSTSESTSAASPLTPVTCWTTDRCPELETGRNSVSPCTTA
ncbi:unknown [Eubacterium sp. CAG:115]|nr:unknown [Eubacterium sp. CAG:115]